MLDVKSTDKLQFELTAYQIDYNEEKIKNLKTEISQKYGVPLKNIEIKFTPIVVDDNGEKISLSKNIIENIQDKNFQILLFEDYLKEKQINDVNLDDIKNIDSEVNDFVNFDRYSKYKRYKIKRISWSNYLSYGADNYFDFTKLEGLVLLNGNPENQCGKTTFAIDLIRFALFGKSPKAPTLDSVFNIYLPNETEVSVELTIEIENVEYVIKRVVTRPPLAKRTEKSKCKQTVTYYKVISDGSLETLEVSDMNEESNTKTNNIIKESVGGIDDFNLVISATANSLGDLLRMGDTEKGKLFSRWLGLLTIEDKEATAKKLWKEKYSPSLVSNRYSRKVLEEEIININADTKEKEGLILQKEESKSLVQKDIERLNQEKTSIMSNKKPIDDSILNITVEVVENQLNDIENKGKSKITEINAIKTEMESIKEITFSQEELDKIKNVIEDNNKIKLDLFNKNGVLKANISNIKKEIEKINSLIEKGICPNCGQKVETSIQNEFIKEKEAECNALINEGVENKQKIEAIDKVINEAKEKEITLLANKDAVAKREKMELKIVALSSNLETLRGEYKNLANKLKDVQANKDMVKWNNDIDIKINNIDIALKEKERIVQNIQTDIATIKGSIQFNNDAISKKEDIIKTIKEEEILIRNWAIYLEMVGKNGIIKIILKRALPIINNELSRMLNGLCDFEVVLDIDTKNNVAINLVRNGKSLELGRCASGFEQTISALALRTALSNIGNMPKPSFIVLDEILGGIGYENIDNIKELYKRMLTSYEFIIHVVHDESYADMHNQTITVVKKDMVSTIELM